VSEKLLGRIPNLVRNLQDDNNADFIYAAYVNSSILDDSVNSDRTAFNLPEDSTMLPFSEVTLSDVREGVLEGCKSFLAPCSAPR